MSKKERMEAGLDEFPQAPVRRRFLVSDITPEGLSLIHAQNPRGLCLWSDELSAWFKNFNRYNNGSEEQFWLSVFNAKPTISDRKRLRYPDKRRNKLPVSRIWNLFLPASLPLHGTKIKFLWKRYLLRKRPSRN